MLLVCDECAFVWRSPDEVDARHAIDLLGPEFSRRLPGVSLSASRWAVPEEVLAYGWGGSVSALNAQARDHGA